jgi:hypothetical protein
VRARLVAARAQRVAGQGRIVRVALLATPVERAVLSHVERRILAIQRIVPPITQGTRALSAPETRVCGGVIRCSQTQRRRQQKRPSQLHVLAQTAAN